MNKIIKHSLVFLRQSLHSKNAWLVMCISIIFSGYVYVPLVRMAAFFNTTVPPVSFVFFLSFFPMRIVYSSLAVLLFSNVLEHGSYQRFLILRSGKLVYFTGLFLFTGIYAALYTLIFFILSIIMTIPVIGSFSTWGKLFFSLMNNPQRLVQESGIALQLSVSLSVLSSLSPLKALSTELLMSWLIAFFIGTLINCFSLLLSRTASLVAVGLLIFAMVFSEFTGTLFIGSWVNYISPLSWAYIGTLDWLKTGLYPDCKFAVLCLSGVILVMNSISIVCFSRKDFT